MNRAVANYRLGRASAALADFNRAFKLRRTSLFCS
jgi:hypothetical protein